MRTADAPAPARPGSVWHAPFRCLLPLVVLLGAAAAQNAPALPAAQNAPALPAAQNAPALPAAQNAPTLSLADVLARAERQTNVALAQAELQGARAERSRVQADPLSTRTALLQAEQRVQLATAQAVRAPKVAQANLAQAYTGVLGAQAGLGLSRAALALSQRNVQVAQIRVQNGAGTRQDLQAAQDGLADANRTAQAAAASLRLARQNLSNRVGDFAAVSGVDVLPPLPGVGLVNTLLNQSPALLQARHQVALAEAQLAALDPLYTPQRHIDEARSGLNRARAALQERALGERTALQNLFDRAVGAQRTHTVRRAERDTAAQALAADRQRLQGGVISPLQLQQREFADLQAAFALLQASNEYLNAYHALQAGGQAP